MPVTSVTYGRTRSLSLALAAGSVPLLLALSLHSQPMQNSAKPLLRSPRQVADALDEIVQPRFQDDRAGVFGTGRVISPIRGHIEAADFQPATPEESRLWEAANSANRRYMIDFLHCAHIPGVFSDTTPTPNHFGSVRLGPDPFKPANASLSELIEQSSPLPPLMAFVADPKLREQHALEAMMRHKAIQKAAVDALPMLLKGRGQEKMTGDWLVVMRPVRASKDSCLTCHVGAKRGDTLGVMVYAVSNTVNKSENAR